MDSPERPKMDRRETFMAKTTYPTSMNENDFTARIYALMEKYELREPEEFLKAIDIALAKREKDKTRLKKYYQDNKDRLDKYHEDYRQEHPEYRQKRSRRAARG